MRLEVNAYHDQGVLVLKNWMYHCMYGSSRKLTLSTLLAVVKPTSLLCGGPPDVMDTT